MWFTDDFARQVWEHKYAGNFTNVRKYYQHLAKVISLGDKNDERKFFSLLWGKRFSPGGRILAFAGRPGSKQSLMNCTTHAITEDSLEGISQAAYTIMKASSRGQGIGVDLSNLRPANAPVDNAAQTSTGAISFMEMLNNIGNVIGQEGRRAAILFTLRADHPDIWRDDGYDFLNIKKTAGKVENANISVLISDYFMRAVKRNLPWQLSFVGKSGGDTFETWRDVNARNLFRALASSAWESAEPGVLFWDTSVRLSNSDQFPGWELSGMNACLTEDATVLTPGGIKELREVDAGDKIWGKNGWTTILKKWSTGVKHTYRYYSSKGVFTGTSDHPVFMNGEVVPVGDASHIDSLQGNLGFEIGELDPQDVMDGLVLGDGFWHDEVVLPYLCIGENDSDYYSSEVRHLISKRDAGEENGEHYAEVTLTQEELPKTYDRVVPERFLRGSPKKMIGFLRGLFSANGYVTRVKGTASRIGLKQTSHKLIRQVQMILSALGIDSYVTISRKKKTKFPNGIYEQKESYDLNLSGGDAYMFMERVGFIQKYKADNYVPPKFDSPYYYSHKKPGIVQSKEYTGEKEVFDITVDDPDHAFWTGGLLVHNCTEATLDQEGVCLGPDTLFMTQEGVRKISSLPSGMLASTNDFNREIAAHFSSFSTGLRNTVLVRLEGGIPIEVTPDHVFITDQGEVEAQNLVKFGAKVRWQEHNPLLSSQKPKEFGVPSLLGWMHGDGWMTENTFGISFNNEDGDFEVKSRLLSLYHDVFGERTPLRDNEVSYQEQTDISVGYEQLKEWGVHLGLSVDRMLPGIFYRWPLSEQLEFLSALFTADGWVFGKKDRKRRVGFSTSSSILADEVQTVLAALGIHSRRVVTTFDNGRNDQYQIHITKNSAKKFMTLIGFMTTKKNEDFVWDGPHYKDKVYIEVISVEPYRDNVPVYDFTAPQTHRGFANGVLVHNCNLGSMNLLAYVDYPFTKWAKFNFKKFRRDIHAAIKFLDNVLTVELMEENSISEQQVASIRNLRRVGLGVMGLADMLAALGIPYSQGPDTEIFRKVFEEFRGTSYVASIWLGMTKGQNKVWKDAFKQDRVDEVLSGGFYPKLSKEIRKAIRNLGMRNITVNSVAPTGSISNLLGVSSGIEPVFAKEYTRRYRAAGNGDEFVDYVHPAVRRSRELGASDEIWETAYQVSPTDHIKVQAAVQEYIDQSISKTVNFPTEATVEDVERAYMLAWELGLKGLTVYRNGSRHEQVLYEKEECPMCGGQVIHQDGCKRCAECTWEMCSI